MCSSHHLETTTKIIWHKVPSLQRDLTLAEVFAGFILSYNMSEHNMFSETLEVLDKCRLWAADDSVRVLTSRQYMYIS